MYKIVLVLLLIHAASGMICPMPCNFNFCPELGCADGEVSMRIGCDCCERCHKVSGEVDFMSYKMYKVLLLMLLICSTVELTRIPCPPDFCDSFECPPVECAKEEHIRKKGDICGCCDTCAIYLYKGDLCFVPILGTPQSFECAEGLICNTTTRTCEEN